VLHLAGDVDSPPLLLRRLEAEALERDPDLDLVAVVGQTPLRLEHEVGAQVGGLPADHRVVEAVAAGGSGLHQRAVRLDAERVHREDDACRPSSKVEQDLDVVVRADLVAVRQRRVHLAVRLIGPDPEMHGGPRIPDQHLGRVRRGDAVHRGEL
jgi:hypothetical protein